MKEIRGKFDLDYGVFAFPHSDNGVKRVFFEEIAKTGLFDITFGTSGLLMDTIPTNFQRISLEKPIVPARKIVSFHLLRKAVKTAIGKGEITRT